MPLQFQGSEIPRFIEVSGIQFVWNEFRDYYEPYIGSRYEREEYKEESKQEEKDCYYEKENLSYY